MLEYQQPWQLFDMRSDRGENFDLAKERAMLLNQLISKWDDWAEVSSVVQWETLPEFHPNYPFQYKRK